MKALKLIVVTLLLVVLAFTSNASAADLSQTELQPTSKLEVVEVNFKDVDLPRVDCLYGRKCISRASNPKQPPTYPERKDCPDPLKCIKKPSKPNSQPKPTHKEPGCDVDSTECIPFIHPCVIDPTKCKASPKPPRKNLPKIPGCDIDPIRCKPSPQPIPTPKPFQPEIKNPCVINSKRC